MDFPVNNGEILVRIQGVGFSYGKNRVLEDVSLEIHKNDFLALIGPNGSGKTTLIKIILGLINPTKGVVRLFGKSLSGFKDWQRIGYVPQKATHFDPFFPISVYEAVCLGIHANRKRRLRSKEEEEKAVKKALFQVGMEPLLHKRMGSLSGGQQQRVFIARAIVNNPDILFLDEPTTGVDTKMHDRFYDMLGTLQKNEGITIVLVTHEIGILNKHITRVACLNKKLIYHGKHSEFCRSEAFKNMLSHGDHLIDHIH